MMNPIFVLLLITVPILILAIVRRKREHQDSLSETPEKNESPMEGEAPEEFFESTPNDRFFEHIDDFSNVIPLVRTYGANDKYMIQSILDANGIPSYLSPQYVNNLLPGVRMKFHTDSIISIDAEDKIEAVILVLEYLESISPENVPSYRSVSASLYNAVAFLHAMPAANEGYRPELLIDMDELVAEMEERAGGSAGS